MSFYESGDSTGEVSLGDLFGGLRCSGSSLFELKDIAIIITHGGWPNVIGRSESVARRIVKNCCQPIFKSEILTADGRMRDQQKMERIFSSLVRNTADQMSDTKRLDDMIHEQNGVNGESSIHINTFRNYLRCLNDIYVTEDLEAWTPKLRSRTAVKTAPTRHLSYSAIATYFLGASAEDLLY